MVFNERQNLDGNRAVWQKQRYELKVDSERRELKGEMRAHGTSILTVSLADSGDEGSGKSGG